MANFNSEQVIQLMELASKLGLFGKLFVLYPFDEVTFKTEDGEKTVIKMTPSACVSLHLHLAESAVSNSSCIYIDKSYIETVFVVCENEEVMQKYYDHLFDEHISKRVEMYFENREECYNVTREKCRKQFEQDYKHLHLSV